MAICEQLNALFFDFINLSTDGVIIINAEGRIIVCNQAIENLLQMKKEEILGQYLWDVQYAVNPPENKTIVFYEQLKSFILELFRNQDSSFINKITEYLIRRPDGSLAVVQSTLFFIAGSFLASIVRDVSELKAVQEQLEKSELQYRGLVENAGVGIASLDREGRFTFCNEALCRISGYDKSVLLGQYLANFIDASDRETFRTSLEADKTHPQAGEGIKLRFRHKEGHLLYVQATPSPVIHHGQLLGFSLILQDITRLVTVEEELKRNLFIKSALTDLYKPLIRPALSIPEICKIILEQAKKLTQSEHGFVSIIEPKTGDMVSHTLTEMMRNSCNIDKSRQTIRVHRGADGLYGNLWGYALNYRKSFFTNSPSLHPAARGIPDGHIPINNFMAVPVLLGDERVGLIALANSVQAYTDKDLDAIERLAEYYALALQRQRAENEMKAVQARYIHTSKLVLLGEMAAGLAHEINQPLSQIALINTTYKKLMEKAALNAEELQRGITDTALSVKRISKIINHIKTFARQDSLYFTDVDINTTIDAALTLLERQLLLLKINIQKDLQNDLPLVTGERFHLEQAWLNLLTNARDALAEKEEVLQQKQGQTTGYIKEIRVVSRYYARTQEVEISFQDNGIGMIEEVKNRIFEPFFTTKPPGKSIGLGLCISYGIIESHQGRVEVESAAGTGTTVRVFLKAKG